MEEKTSYFRAKRMHSERNKLRYQKMVEAKNANKKMEVQNAQMIAQLKEEETIIHYLGTQLKMCYDRNVGLEA